MHHTISVINFQNGTKLRFLFTFKYTSYICNVAFPQNSYRETKSPTYGGGTFGLGYQKDKTLMSDIGVPTEDAWISP